jgi:hypothetical protein
MATVGAKLTIPFIVGTGQIVGQGNTPEAWVLYSTSDVTDTSPVWVDATAKLRGFSVSRGRENELNSIDAGTATVALNNRNRTFDPAFNSGIRPLNRWWIREQFSGETQDMFVGYAEAYKQEYPPPGFSDAVTTVTCSDEFKLLSLDALPTTSPPRANYVEVVMFDRPAGFWGLTEPPEFRIQPATVPEDTPTPTPANPSPAGPAWDPAPGWMPHPTWPT